MPWHLEWYLLRHKNYLNCLFLFLLLQNAVASWMIAVMLRKYLKRIYLFLLSRNAVIFFRNKKFGSKLKAHFFSDFFSFKTQRCKSSKKCVWSLKIKKSEKKCALSSEANYFMRIVESKKVRLEFELCIVGFRNPGNTYFWLE